MRTKSLLINNIVKLSTRCFRNRRNFMFINKKIRVDVSMKLNLNFVIQILMLTFRFSILKHCHSKFALKTCFTIAQLHWKFFFFWTKIWKIFNEFLSKRYMNAKWYRTWYFLKIFFLSFVFEILRVFWYEFQWIFWNFTIKTFTCCFYLLHWYCFYALKINALKKKTTVIRSRYRTVNSCFNFEYAFA